jgi:hypothetical protein
LKPSNSREVQPANGTGFQPSRRFGFSLRRAPCPTALDGKTNRRT